MRAGGRLFAGLAAAGLGGSLLHAMLAPVPPAIAVHGVLPDRASDRVITAPVGGLSSEVGVAGVGTATASTYPVLQSVTGPPVDLGAKSPVSVAVACRRPDGPQQRW